MIHEIDQLLEGMVRSDALNGSGVEIAFDAPTKDWVARRNAPLVDMYLYDIREDLQRRSVGWGDVREGNRVTERRPPARWFKLSYLVTAWTQRPEDEHRLLSSLLGALLRHELIPAADLTGPLGATGLPIHMFIALPPSQDRSLADVWSALGGELKPSLDLTVVAPFVLGVSAPVGPPVLEEARLRMEGPDGGEMAGGGRAGDRVPAAARVPYVEEVITSGTPDRPGRRLRVRGIPPR